MSRNGSELSRSEEYLGGGLSVEWKPSDRLTLTVDGSYSRTIRKEVERNFRLRTDPMRRQRRPRSSPAQQHARSLHL